MEKTKGGGLRPRNPVGQNSWRDPTSDAENAKTGTSVRSFLWLGDGNRNARSSSSTLIAKLLCDGDKPFNRSVPIPSCYKLRLTIFVKCIDNLRAKLLYCYTVKISVVKLNWSGSDRLRGRTPGIWNGKKQRGGWLSWLVWKQLGRKPERFLCSNMAGFTLRSSAQLLDSI